MKLCYTIKEVARMLRVNYKTVKRSIDRGEIKATTIGREKRIMAKEVRRLLGLDDGEDIGESYN